MMAKRGDRPTVKQSWPIETELRLAGDPDTLLALFSSPLMASQDGGGDKLTNLESSYYDTEDRLLRAKGLALRVRADGTSHQQTLKAGDADHAALLKRGEWTVAIDGDQPELEALPEEAQTLLPKAVRKGSLQKAFATHVQRRIREVVINGQNKQVSRIEAALDLGDIETDSGSLPVAEIELELLEGPPQSLYQLALDLQELGPVRLETRSKSSRAYDRLGDQPPSWHQATTPTLDPADTVDDAMAAIFASCFDQWLANQAAAFDGRDPEGVHQMRVGLRRLRSAFSVFRTLIPASQQAWLRDGAARTIRALGPARDWDVFQSDLLAPLIAARPEDRALRALRTKARTKGRASYRAVRRSLENADYTEFALRFGQWVEARAWRHDADATPDMAKRQATPITTFAKRFLKKRHKKAIAAGEDFAGQTIEQRHNLRIVLKKLRYTTEFFQPLFDKKAVKSFLASVKTLQDDLGYLNDVAVAEALLSELLAKPGQQDLSTAAGMVIGWHVRGGSLTEPRLLNDWNAFAEQPIFWD